MTQFYASLLEQLILIFDLQFLTHSVLQLLLALETKIMFNTKIKRLPSEIISRETII